MKKILYTLIACSSVCSAIAQVDLNKGLMLHLPFNGNTMDASTNANHATNMGATLTTDQWGNPNSAYLFDGKSNYMQIPNTASLQCDSQITLCARVKPNGFYNGICNGNSIIDKGNPDFLAGNYFLRYSVSNPLADCNLNDTTQENYYAAFYDQVPSNSTFNSMPYVKINEWDCLVYTFDGAEMKMYVNGIMRYKMNTTKLIGKNTQALLLGRHGNPTYPYWFDGVMDEIRIYNRALNLMEIDSVCSKSNPQQTAIRSVKPIEHLKLVANPVNKELQLSISAENMGGELNIIDMAGRKVFTIAHLQQNVIAIDDITAGIYIVTYKFENNYLRAKMIKH